MKETCRYDKRGFCRLRSEDYGRKNRENESKPDKETFFSGISGRNSHRNGVFCRVLYFGNCSQKGRHELAPVRLYVCCHAGQCRAVCRHQRTCRGGRLWRDSGDRAGGESSVSFDVKRLVPKGQKGQAVFSPFFHGLWGYR